MSRFVPLAQGCTLEVPAWARGFTAGRGMLDEFFPDPRRRAELPASDRLVLDEELLVEAASTCAPSTWGTLPLDEVLLDTAFAFNASQTLLDIGAGAARP